MGTVTISFLCNLGGKTRRSQASIVDLFVKVIRDLKCGKKKSGLQGHGAFTALKRIRCATQTKGELSSDLELSTETQAY